MSELKKSNDNLEVRIKFLENCANCAANELVEINQRIDKLEKNRSDERVLVEDADNYRYFIKGNHITLSEYNRLKEIEEKYNKITSPPLNTPLNTLLTEDTFGVHFLLTEKEFLDFKELEQKHKKLVDFITSPNRLSAFAKMLKIKGLL